jgi:hypothetical protein
VQHFRDVRHDPEPTGAVTLAALRLDGVPTAVVEPEVAGLFVAWTAAAAAAAIRELAAERAASAIEVGTDGHVVDGLPGHHREATIGEAIGWLLDAKPHQIGLALPVAGDPLGLSGAGDFADAALLAESGVTIDCTAGSFGLVPEPDLRGSSYRGVRWRMHPTPSASMPAVGADPQRIIEQADRALRRALRAATDALDGVDLARWRDESVAGRGAADAAFRVKPRPLPPAWPPAARALAERALALWRVVRVAALDAGAASASGSAVRTAALRDLSHAVREAAMTAYNVPAGTALGSR